MTPRKAVRCQGCLVDFLALDHGDKEIRSFGELENWYYSWFIVQLLVRLLFLSLLSLVAFFECMVSCLFLTVMNLALK
jgi:hypothetical protein